MIKGDRPVLDEDHPQHSLEQQRAYYEKKGIVFVEDEWSLLQIRVWMNAREMNGFGVSVNAGIVFRYADKFEVDDIEMLERVNYIQRGVESG